MTITNEIEGSPGRGRCRHFDSCRNARAQKIARINGDHAQIIGYYCSNCSPSNLRDYDLCRNRAVNVETKETSC
jgi:hypothetical protein